MHMHLEENYLRTHGIVSVSVCMFVSLDIPFFAPAGRRAVATLRGDSAKTEKFVQECAETSLRLLEVTKKCWCVRNLWRGVRGGGNRADSPLTLM